MKPAYSLGLQSMALAMIFMPEPVTTVVGIGLLGYARGTGQQKSVTVRRLTNTFDDQYSYRLNMVRGTSINYQLSPRSKGQLPKLYPKIARLHDNPQVVKALCERAKRQYTCTSFPKIEPAGLMRGPGLRARAALATSKNLANHKMR